MNSIPIDTADPWLTEQLISPYAHYETMRALGPISYNEKYGFWSLYRYADVNEAMSDWEQFCSSRGVGLTNTSKDEAWRTPSLLLNNDPPNHTEMRKIAGKVFSPAAIRGLRERFTGAANTHISNLGGDCEINAAAQIGEAFPISVFPDAVGVRKTGRQNLVLYGQMAFNSEGPKNAIYEESFKAAEPVHAWINESCQREMLDPVGFGADIWAAHDEGLLTAQQAGLLVRSVLTAGLDTTMSLIGNMILAFARHPDQWELLRCDHSLIKPAVEEALRYDSPVQLFFRTTTRDVEVAGHLVPDNSKVFVSLGSANRDPDKWGPTADQFDITRVTAGHLGFGVGIHRCLGQMVARLEAEVILSALVSTYKTIELIGEPTIRLNNVVRSYTDIPVRLTT